MSFQPLPWWLMAWPKAQSRTTICHDPPWCFLYAILHTRYCYVTLDSSIAHIAESVLELFQNVCLSNFFILIIWKYSYVYLYSYSIHYPGWAIRCTTFAHRTRDSSHRPTIFYAQHWVIGLICFSYIQLYSSRFQSEDDIKTAVTASLKRPSADSAGDYIE